MNRPDRRKLLLGGVAFAASVAGVGGGWWHSRQGPADLPSPPAGDGADFWALRFDQPGGSQLVLADMKGRPLLLNFWATWCPPCVTEMPLLDRFHTERRAQGWQVVGLAVDSPTPVREFLARQPMGFPIGLAGLKGIELARSLGNPSGALPFSVVFDRQGKAIRTKLGALQDKDLADWASALT